MTARALARLVRMLNLVDCIATLALVDAVGPAAEFNPIMRAVLEFDPLAFVLVKLIGVAVLSEVLVRYPRVWVIYALYAVACTYVVTLAAHAAWMVQ